MALEVLKSDTTNETSKFSLELEVDPRTVAYCIGRGKSNLKDIGNQVLEKTGNSVYIKYINPKTTNWGHFSIVSHSDTAIEIARDLIRESEGKFLANKQDYRIHPTTLDFQVKMPKSNDHHQVGYSKQDYNQPRNQHYVKTHQRPKSCHGRGRSGNRNNPRQLNQPTENRKNSRNPTNHQHKRDFNGQRRQEEIPTHFSWEG